MPAGDDLPILYADEHLLVVAKPRRCLVVAAPGRSCPTLVDRVGRQLGERVHAVHRLDEDTTGMIVLARSADAKQRLEELSQQHGARRIYLALAARVPSPAAGRIEFDHPWTGARVVVECAPDEPELQP